ncbi:MAG: class I SAM-dependent methyltransferase [Candidatus Bathyarchaeia archaeon]
MWKRKLEVMLHYNQTAVSYDAQYAEEQNAKIRAALSDAHLREDGLVLDMGCGTGLLFPNIADKARLLVGLDISPNLLRQAQKHAKQYPNIALVQADADHTPFKNQTFHTLFAITLLQNMPEPTATLEEMKRITKPEAVIILTSLKKKFTREAITEILEKTGLKVTTLKTNSKIKDHIITCQNQAFPNENHATQRRKRQEENR